MAEAKAKTELQAVAETLDFQPESLTEPVGTRQKSWWKTGWFWAVIVPFAAALLYYTVIATDRYVSEAKVIVKKAGPGNQSLPGIPLLGTSLGAEMHDVILVRDFILSGDMLRYLDEELKVRNHYQSVNADLLTRLHVDSSYEQFLSYYRSRIELSLDEISGVLTIRVQGFEPTYSQNMVTAIIERSEQFINQISQQLARDHVAFVQGEMERAQQHLKERKQQILAFQDEYQLVSPVQETGARLQVINDLEAELIRLQTELKNLSSYMNETAADIVSLQGKIDAIKSQLTIERNKLVGSEQRENMTSVNANFAELELELEFATDVYKTSLIGLEQARIEAYRKLKHLVVIDSPSLAEHAEYPRRLYNMATILVCLSLLYGLVVIVYATIKEHK